jgi:cobalamin biosynthesis protein CobD/CbiB
MAAMAGALGLHLTKRGHYSLNDLGRPARPTDIGRACRIVLASAALAALAADLS